MEASVPRAFPRSNSGSPALRIWEDSEVMVVAGGVVVGVCSFFLQATSSNKIASTAAADVRRRWTGDKINIVSFLKSIEF